MRNIVFIAFSFGLYWCLKWIYLRWKGVISSIVSRVFDGISVGMALLLIFGTPYFGTKIPGSFFERNEYTAMLYVYLFPNAQKVMSYRIPAKINASVISDTSPDDTNYSYSQYRIEYALMPSGNRINFENSDCDLQIDKTIELYDDNGKYWGVMLTDNAVKK